jgi:AraC-like DNA-binding protein
MFDVPSAAVRTQWSFDVARACQRFVGGVIDPEPDELVRAVEILVHSLPIPDSSVESFVLRDRLRIVTQNAADQFHAQFHRYVRSTCDSRWKKIDTAVDWQDFDRTPSALLTTWVSEYLAEFATSHEWPAPVRVARLIRGSFTKPLNIERLARSVGCARSGLSRSFKAAFGMSMGDYHARCRIRPAINLLRHPTSNVGEAAFTVGYGSTKNFYRALRDLTGMTPTQLRELSHEGADDLLNAVVLLPLATVQ